MGHRLPFEPKGKSGRANVYVGLCNLARDNSASARTRTGVKGQMDLTATNKFTICHPSQFVCVCVRVCVCVCVGINDCIIFHFTPS